MAGYGQFCPVAKTAEVLCERWTVLVLRELLSGSTHFSEIQRGVPLMSPTLLYKRLRRLAAAGIITREPAGRGATYAVTAAGWELYPIVEAMGRWGQRWVRSDYSPDELDPSLLMWDLRRMLRPAGLAEVRTVVEFRFREAPRGRTRYWLVVDEVVDLCLVDPGHDVDLVVVADLRALTEAWMGDRTLRAAMADGSIDLIGPRDLARRFVDWLGTHPVLGSTPRQSSSSPAAEKARA